MKFSVKMTRVQKFCRSAPMFLVFIPLMLGILTANPLMQSIFFPMLGVIILVNIIINLILYYHIRSDSLYLSPSKKCILFKDIVNITDLSEDDVEIEYMSNKERRKIVLRPNYKDDFVTKLYIKMREAKEMH